MAVVEWKYPEMLELAMRYRLFARGFNSVLPASIYIHARKLPRVCDAQNRYVHVYLRTQHGCFLLSRQIKCR